MALVGCMLVEISWQPLGVLTVTSTAPGDPGGAECLVSGAVRGSDSRPGECSAPASARPVPLEPVGGGVTSDREVQLSL